MEPRTSSAPASTPRKDGPPHAGGVEPETLQVADGRLSIQWTAAYYVILVAGTYGFYEALFPLTESSRGRY